jgi:uncharacterized membrane protein
VAITHHLERMDAGLARLNLVLLLVVSFIPFPTKLVTERLTPVLAVYGGMIALAFVLPGLAVAGYLGVAVYRLVPVGLRRR